MSPIVSAFGGAPQGSPEDVAELIRTHTDVPFLPSDVATSLTGWLDGEPRALSDVARVVLEQAPSGRVVETAPGPLTLAMAARAAAHPAYRTHLALDALVSWLEKRQEEVSAIRDDVMVLAVLDEPALAAFAPDAVQSDAYRDVAVSVLGSMVERSPVPVAIRTSDDTDWSLIAEARPALLGWNVTDLGFGFDQHVDSVARAVGEGMGVMWGVAGVEPAPQSSDDVTLTRYRTALAKLVVAGAPIGAIRDHAWFVPNGSMERLGTDRARRVLENVAAIAGEADD